MLVGAASLIRYVVQYQTTTQQHIQGPLEVAEEDDVRCAEIVDAFRSGPSGMVDGPAQLNDGGPNLDIEHAAFIQKQHLPTARLDF